jgi:hypothetical protein
MTLFRAREPSPRTALLDVADGAHRYAEVAGNSRRAARIVKGTKGLGRSYLGMRRSLSARHRVVLPTLNVVVGMSVVPKIGKTVVAPVSIIVATLHAGRPRPHEGRQHQYVHACLLHDGATPKATGKVRASLVAKRDFVGARVAVTCDAREIFDAPLIGDLVKALPSNNRTPCLIGQLHEGTIP